MTVKNSVLFEEILHELEKNILPFWIKRTVDEKNGGFYGYMTHEGQVEVTAEKGGILNSRILWTYSKAYCQTGDPQHLKTATHAFDFLKNNFLDDQYGGIYWMLDYHGHPTEPKKHIYNQSFAIYGLSEYYQATKKEESLEIAIELFHLIEKYAYDNKNKGYFEAFTKEWKEVEDQSLSGKDMNAAKSMNTHLHILEAYTNLYRVWKDELLKEKLDELIQITIEHIINPETNQFKLYFNEAWHSLSDVVSYGHDIEGSWLLHEAAEVLGDSEILTQVETIAIKMADKVLQDGFDQHGGLMNELEDGEFDRDKVWWVQAEGMVGFLNAYQLTKQEKYLDATKALWDFTSSYIIDKQNGEWFWKVDGDGNVAKDMPKVEPWKCSYHNSRFCFEVLERLERI
ncbi:AGE family epimerase/isomerase [Salipaludibacillus sp. HK11]|uniref:AGE family epimerase/isomerase n=1 Tax=Salipaludibacillus sp. HK11 TaxID=3394320 RepID=UPI0039FD8476